MERINTVENQLDECLTDQGHTVPRKSHAFISMEEIPGKNTQNIMELECDMSNYTLETRKQHSQSTDLCNENPSCTLLQQLESIWREMLPVENEKEQDVEVKIHASTSLDSTVTHQVISKK